MNQLTDTSPEAERVWIEAYRRMSVGRKWLVLGETYESARMLHAAGQRLRNREVTPRQIRQSWMAETLNFFPGEPIPEPVMDQPAPNLGVLREVVRAFENLDIPYALGGSMASSIHGVTRFTRDADLTAEPFPGKESRLVACFGPDYYLSPAAILEAVQDRSSFNIINTSVGFKVDVFVRKDEAFEQSAMQRRMMVDLPDVPGQPLAVQSPEDVILFKLRWYRLGNESSDQQWGDVLGVWKIQAGRLDQAYLDQWAAPLGISGLLRRVRLEVGSPS